MSRRPRGAGYDPRYGTGRLQATINDVDPPAEPPPDRSVTVRFRPDDWRTLEAAAAMLDLPPAQIAMVACSLGLRGAIDWLKGDPAVHQHMLQEARAENPE